MRPFVPCFLKICTARFSISRFHIKMLHVNCRSKPYPQTDNEVARFPVPDEKVSWKVEFPEYTPSSYTACFIGGQPWADPDIDDPSFNPQWNSQDNGVDRRSHVGVYDIVNSLPLNIVGRTGLAGRGVLGRWGPNHAADPIVTRWKRNGTKDIILHEDSDKQILQFVAIQRSDTLEWGLPGGMVDPGEKVGITLKREFKEEALNIFAPDERNTAERIVNEFFEHGTEIYRGYVDDHRNTDNAWIETVAVNFHDEYATTLGNLPLCSGDDAINVIWIDMTHKLKLYANHLEFLARVAEIHDSHW